MTPKKFADVLTMNPIQETQNRSHRLVLIDELPLYRRGVIELVRRIETAPWPLLILSVRIW
jgi:hypothetical protein